MKVREAQQILSFMLENFRDQSFCCGVLSTINSRLVHLDIIRASKEGKSGMYEAAEVLSYLNNWALETSVEFYTLDKYIAENQPDSPESVLRPEAYIRVKEFLEHKATAMSYHNDLLEKVQKKFEEALSDQAFLTYVKKNPDKAHEDLQKVLAAVGHAAGMVGGAATVTSSAGRFNEYVKAASLGLRVCDAVIQAGLLVTNKMLLEASEERQKKLLKESKEGLKTVTAYLDDNPLMVAQVIADQYVERVEFNLDMLGPLLTGSNMMLDVVIDMAPPPVSNFDASMLWSTIRSGIVNLIRGAAGAHQACRGAA